MRRTLLTLAAGLPLAAAGAIGLGGWRFRRMVACEVADLKAGARAKRTPITYADLAGLPEPVQRSLRYSLAEGTVPLRVARVGQTGTFRPRHDGPWLEFTAEQTYSADPPGFIWRARMKTNPAVWVDGRDKYVEGAGNMLIKPMGLFAAVNATGPEMDSSSLIRYLSELPWLPSALLPSPYLRWEAIDDHSARAIIADRGREASGIFTFDDEGRATGFSSAERYREANGQFIRTPWVGHFEAYREVAPGIRIPSGGEVGWVLPDEGYSPYVRIQLTEVAYE